MRTGVKDLVTRAGPPGGWGLWEVVHGSGWGMTGFPWQASARFDTQSACETAKAQRIQQMAGMLAGQFQAGSGVTMTDSGWRQDLGGQGKFRMTKETVFVCAHMASES
jgi:hypothetical protein